MAYVRKTRDEYQLLCDYGYGDGWEYILAEDTMKEARQRKKEYIVKTVEADFSLFCHSGA